MHRNIYLALYYTSNQYQKEAWTILAAVIFFIYLFSLLLLLFELKIFAPGIDFQKEFYLYMGSFKYIII